jgi:hypothetical protein
MSRPKKGPHCGTCRNLGAPTNDKGDRLLGKGSFRFPCNAPFEMPLKPAAFDVVVKKNLVTTADGEGCPAYKAIINVDKPQPVARASRKKASAAPKGPDGSGTELPLNV